MCFGGRCSVVVARGSVVLASGIGCGRVVLLIFQVVLAVELAKRRSRTAGMGRGICSSELEAFQYGPSPGSVVDARIKGGCIGMLEVAKPGRVVDAIM